MLNHCIIMGRLKEKPELRNTDTGRKVASFTIASQRDVSYRSENNPVDWINCVIWDKAAENFTQWVEKGTKVIVQGRLQTRNWEDIHKQTRNAVEVYVSRWEFAEKKKKDSPDVDAGDYNDGSTPSRPRSNRQARFTELPDDGDLPF